MSVVVGVPSRESSITPDRRSTPSFFPFTLQVPRSEILGHTEALRLIVCTDFQGHRKFPFLNCQMSNAHCPMSNDSVRYVRDLHTAVGGVQESGSIAEFSLVLLERVAFYDVFSTQAHVHVGNHGREQLLIDVADTEEFAS